MKDKNVCKFSSLTQSHSLEIRCFVQETNPEVMAQRVQLKSSRAYLFTQGEGELHTDGGVTALRPGMLIFGFEHEWVSITPRERCGYMYIDGREHAAVHLFPPDGQTGRPGTIDQPYSDAD